MNESGPAASRIVAFVIVMMFCILPVLPMAQAAGPRVSITSPRDGEIVSRFVSVEAKIDVQHPSSMSLSIDGMYYADMVEIGFANPYWKYKFSLNTWGLSDGAHLLQVNPHIDGAANATFFFVDNFAPTITNITVKYPEGQKAAKKGDRLIITAQVRDNTSGISKVTCDASKLLAGDSITMSDDGQHNDTVQGDGVFGSDPILVNALTNGYNIVKVTAVDKRGNERTVVALVSMDNHPPDIKEPIVIYPTGQSAAKLGDQIRIVSKVEDKGEGGILRVGTDVVFVLDNSGSMINGMDPPMNYLKAAVNNFINMTNPEDRVAIFGFGTNNDGDVERYENAKMYMEYRYMDEPGKQAVRNLLDDPFNEFNYAHNTPIWDTIGAAIEYANSQSLHKPVVVAMTDGTDYGYDWYARPDPSWWQAAYDAGYYGVGFERGSEMYCPWNDWGDPVIYNTHYGEYPAPWVGDTEIHSFDVPIVDDLLGFDYSQQGDIENYDFASGLRYGLLNAPVPIFTVGLGLPHHSPLQPNTTEFDLYSIASTSENATIKGRYYYAPQRGDLADIYSDISFFINLAGDINTTPPGGVKTLALEAQALGVPMNKVLSDDGEHDDVFVEDETFGTDKFDVNTRVTDYVNVTLDAVDIAKWPATRNVEVKVDNIPPTISGLVPHVLDPTTLKPSNKTYAQDGMKIFFTVNATDVGKISGLTKVLLDGSPLGGDPAFVMLDDGIWPDENSSDEMFTSPIFDVNSGGVNGFVLINATAYDIANNQASVTAPTLCLNALDVIGQIVQPLNNSVVTGEIEVRLVVSDDKPIIGTELIIQTVPPPGETPVRTKSLMAHANEKDVYLVVWNTTAYPDGAFDLLAYMTNKGGFKVPTLPVRVYVDNTRPVVKIEQPKNGDIVTNKTQLLALIYDPPRTYNGGENLTSVTYVMDNGTSTPMSLKGGIDVGGPHYVLNIDPAVLKDGVHKVTVLAIDRVGLWARDNVTFITDTQPPFVEPVYVPSTAENTSGTFMYDFNVKDTSGVADATLSIDAGKKGELSVPLYLNTTSGLWEYSLDTTKLTDGNHTYCAIFKDKAGMESKYCSKLVVSNAGVKPPKKIIHVKELPWWFIVLFIIILSCLVFTTGILAREWYLKRTAKFEDEEEMVEKATRRAKAERRGETIPVPGGEGGIEDLDMDEDHGADLPDDMPPPELPVDLPPLLEPAKKGAKVKRSTTPRGSMTVTSIAPEEVAAPSPEASPIADVPKKSPKKVIKCPMCMFKIPVESDVRPLVLTCPKCGAKGKLK